MGTCTAIYVLSKNKKTITIFHLKIIIFTAVKYCCILHGRVFVMAKPSSFVTRAYDTILEQRLLDCGAVQSVREYST